MDFKFSLDSASRFSGELIFLAILCAIFWLVVLIAALTRKDLDPVTKFMWVFVVVSTSLIGAILYLILAKRDFGNEGGAASDGGN